MKLRFVPILLLLVAAIALPGTTTHTKAEEGYTLRIASLAPAGSSWMKILNAWNKTLKEKTRGKLKMRFYPGGSQGDERDFVRKMRVGQLDGGVVTTTGMSMLVPSVVVLILPGLLDTYEKLDRVRLKMAKDFEKLFVDEGFLMVAWGDAGTRAAAENGEIEVIKYADRGIFVILFGLYSNLTTVVYGD